MSDNIDIPIEASGDDGVNRLTSAVDRLIVSMEELGNSSAAANLAKQMEQMQTATNTALGALTSQMAEMKQVLATGFADISATNQKLIEGMGASQARAIEANGDKAAAAVENSNMKVLMAVERQKDRQLAADNALNLAHEGMLAGAKEREIALEVAFDRAQAQIAEKRATARVLDFDRESKVEAEWIAMLESATDKKLSLESAFDRAQSAMEQQRAAARALDFDRESKLEAEWVAMLESATDKKLALESAFDRVQSELEQKRTAARVLDFDRESKIEAEWVAMLEAANEKKLALDAAFNRAQAAAETRRETQAEAAANRQRALNANYLTASPTSQVRTAAQAQLYSEMGGDAVAKYGSAAAAVDALTQAELRLAAALSATKSAAVQQAEALERQRVLNTNYLTASPSSQVHTAMQAQQYAQLGGDPVARYGSAAAEANALAAAQARLALTAKEAGAAQLELDGALKQAEGAFRGAAHQAGIYGLHHGQLISLLAGGAVAAALHHIAETGAEVEFQLASLNALGDKFEQNPIDFNGFIGITAGTMTRLKDAAEGVHALAQAGQSQGAAFAALPDIMRLAQLGEMSVAQASELAVESMHAFGKSITDIGEIGDILVAVGSQANVSVHKLAEDMKSAATTGETFGMTMQEITAAVGTLAERGLTIQPLSSAMLKLYEPSDKTAKVMKQLGIEVKDAETNSFRPFKTILEDLAHILDGYSNKADVLKGMGFSSRDMKAVEAMTQHHEDFEHLLDAANNAQGKTFDAMVVKMDTAEGAWKRLGSTVEGSFTKAFIEASPAIRAVEEDLMRMAGSDGAVNSLENLAVGAARLTKTFVENIGVVATLVASYGAMRMLSGLTLLVSNFTAAKARQAVVTAEAAAANTAEAVTLEVLTAAEAGAATGAAGLAAATEVAATGMRLLTAAVGWIGVAIVAATAAYELLSGKMSEADKEHLKQKNTYDTTTDAIQQEIERLKGLERQLMLTGTTGVVAASMVHLAFAQMKETAARGNLEAAEESPAPNSELGLPGRLGRSAKSGEQLKRDNVAKLKAELDAAHGEVLKAQNAVAELETLQDHVAVLTNVSRVKKEIKELPAEVHPANDTEAARKAAEYANEGLRALKGQEVTEANVLQMEEMRAEVAKDVAIAQKRFEKPEAGDKDSARVRIEQLQEELRIAQALSKEHLADLKSQNKRGELGDLQLINAELKDKLALDQKAVDMARAELAAAGPLKPGQRQKYQSRIDSAENQKGIDTTAAERARLDVLDKMDTEELQARARALTSKGQLEDAYNLNWQAKNATLMANLTNDIAAAENGQYKDRLERFKAFLEEQRRLGANDARFKEAKNDFGATSAELSQRLNYLKLQSGPGTGLGSQLTNLSGQRDTYGEMLPKMQAAQNRVSALSSVMYSGPDAKEKLKEARSELQEIQTQMAAMRNTAVTMADAIAKALTDAFGKGGTAIGGMIVAATSYDTKMKEIQQTLKDHGDTDAARKAAADSTSSAQIKAYGDMAGAAKGFFDQNSNGYKIMATAEKAFRAIELAEAGATLAKKLFFKGAEVTAAVAGDAAKVASGTVATGASVAAAGTEASAWGITAVVRAIASLPFPMNLVAGAATMAAVVAVGAKLMGGMGGGSTTAADRQAANGTGTIAGDPKAKSDSIAKSLAAVESNTFNDLNVSQDMLSALRSIESNISSFAGQLLQNSNIAHPETHLNASNGLAKTVMSWAAGGVVLGSLLAKIPVLGNLFDKIGTAIFGGKQSLDDTGFMMGPTTLAAVAAGGANAKTYADVTTSGGWFSSDKHNTQSASVGADSNRAISQIITGIGDTIKSAAGILGLAGSEFDAKLNGFVIDLGKISLKGLSASDQQAAIQAAFSKLGDQMAQSAVSTITQFSKAGEGALQTLTRVAADYQMVDAVFASYGTAFSQVGIESIAAREHLIDLAGGLDKFTSQASFFLQNFLTKGQQTAAQRAAIDPTLAKYGLSSVGPDAVANFTKVAIAMGAMGPAGAEAYTALMNIAPAFKAVTDVAKDLQTQIDDLLMTQAQKDARDRAALDPTNQGLFDQLQQAKLVAQAKADLVSAYDSESQAMQSGIDKLKAFSLSLRNFVNSLQQGNLSPLNPTDKYGAAMADFETTLAKAKAGDTTAQGSLQSVAQTFLTASRAANASNSTYQRDYQRVVSATDQMATVADQQAAVGQESLNALHDQVSHLIGIKVGVMSVVDAMNNLAIVMTHGSDASANTTALTAIYHELLNRAPDQAGLEYWNTLLQAGVSLTTIIDDIKHSVEYASMSHDPTSSVTASTQYGAATTVIGAPATQAAGAQQDPTTAISNLYQQLLHRAPDQAGLAYWVQQANAGTSLSAIADQMRVGSEYTGGTSLPSAPAPAVQGPDPYAAAAVQNAQMLAQMAAMNAQLAALRTEQQTQNDQVIDATMNAGAGTGEQVAEAITTTNQASSWKLQNQMALR